ncbi:MAG: hypothetical protein ACM31C_22055 [Acidobacteriota bacterium]
MRLAVWIAVLALGCGKSKAKCQAEADDLVRFLRATDHGGQVVKVDDDMHLVLRPELAHGDPVMAPVVVIEERSIVYQGQLCDDVAELRERLADTFAKQREGVARGQVPKHFVWDKRLYLEIDAAAKWGTIAAAADTAGEVGYVPYFVFAVPARVRPPPRAPIDDELDRIAKGEDPASKATRFAKQLGSQIDSCPALTRLFGTVSSEEDDKAKFLIDGLGPALVDCDCKPDLANLRAAMYRLLADEHPIGNVPVTIARDAPPLELPATMTWKEASAKLAPNAKAWLVAR